MDLAGRTYADYLELPDEDWQLAVQMDCVEGARRSTKAILSPHFLRLIFQIYTLLPEKTQRCAKEALGALKTYCEGAFAEAFRRSSPIGEASFWTSIK